MNVAAEGLLACLVLLLGWFAFGWLKYGRERQPARWWDAVAGGIFSVLLVFYVAMWVLM